MKVERVRSLAYADSQQGVKLERSTEDLQTIAVTNHHFERYTGWASSSLVDKQLVSDGWTTDMHMLTWKASGYAYANSNCPNFGRGLWDKEDPKNPGVPPSIKCAPHSRVDVPGMPGIWAWRCNGFLLVAIRGTDVSVSRKQNVSVKPVDDELVQKQNEASTHLSLDTPAKHDNDTNQTKMSEEEEQEEVDCEKRDLMADHDLFDRGFIASAGANKDEDTRAGYLYVLTVKRFILDLKEKEKKQKGSETPIVVTGHSLGGGLAMLAAMATEVPAEYRGRPHEWARDPVVAADNVWAYGAPPVSGTLESGMHLMYNTNDPVFKAVKERRPEQLAGPEVCLFTGATDRNCESCLNSIKRNKGDAGKWGVIWTGSVQCAKCWLKSHVLGAYGPVRKTRAYGPVRQTIASHVLGAYGAESPASTAVLAAMALRAQRPADTTKKETKLKKD